MQFIRITSYVQVPTTVINNRTTPHSTLYVLAHSAGREMGSTGQARIGEKEDKEGCHNQGTRMHKVGYMQGG